MHNQLTLLSVYQSGTLARAPIMCVNLIENSIRKHNDKLHVKTKPKIKTKLRFLETCKGEK